MSKKRKLQASGGGTDSHRPNIYDRYFLKVAGAVFIVVLFWALVTVFTDDARGGTAPQVKVEQTWVYAGQSKYNIPGDSSDVTAAMQRVFRDGSKREIILDTNAVYYVTDTLPRLGEGTTIDGRGASIYIEDSGAVRGVWAPNGGVTIRNLTVYQIDPTHSKLTGDGSYGCAITIGEYPEPNPATPCDNVVIENVKVGTDKLHGYGLGVFGLVRNPDISKVTFIGGDSAYGVLAVEWAYNADSTATEHPTNVRASGIYGDSFFAVGANPIYCSAVDGLILENCIIGYSANNGIAVVPGEQGFSLADPLYHHRGDTVYNSGTDVRNCQIRTVGKSGFVTYGKPTSSPTKRVYSRTTFTNCSVDSSLAWTYHAGFLIDYTDGVEINNCFVKDNYIGIRLNDGARNTTIIGSTIVSNKYAGIYSNGTTEPPDGTVIFGNTIEGNGDSISASGIIMPAANKSANILCNDFGKSSGETQVYGFDKSAVGGKVNLFLNHAYGFTGGAAYRVTDSVSCAGNEAPKDSTVYSGTGAPFPFGNYSIPFALGAANQLLKVSSDGTTLAYRDDSLGSAGSYLPLNPTAGDSLKANLNMSGHYIYNVGILTATFVCPNTLWPVDGHLDVLGSYVAGSTDTVWAGILRGDSISVAAKAVIAGQTISSDASILSETEAHDSLAGYATAIHEHDNITADTFLIYNEDSTQVFKIYYDATGTPDIGWTMNGGSKAMSVCSVSVDSSTGYIRWGTMRLTAAIADSMINQLGRFAGSGGGNGDTLAHTFYVDDDTLKSNAAKMLVGGRGETMIMDSLASPLIRFTDSATGILRWGTLHLGAAQFDSLYNQKGRFAGGTGTVTDLILGDSLNSYPDTAATVDTILSCLTDANIPNSITIDNASDVDTGGTKINTALNTRADKAGPTFSLKVTVDSIVGDSAQFTQLDVTNARIATAFTMPRAKNPTTTSGQMAVDTNNAALEVYADGGGINSSVLIPMLVDKDFCIVDPNTVNDTIDLFLVSDLIYPFGVTLRKIELVKNDSVGSYSIQFEEWSGKKTRSRAGYIDTVTIATDSSYGSTTVFTDAAMAAGNSIRAIIPSTSTDEISGKITFTVNPGD